MDFWFTSDQHFNHTGILKFSNRPFSTVEEMNQAIISRWNQKIKSEDVVYVLGDVFFSLKTNNERYTPVNILARLNGRKILIVGNHDRDPNKLLNLGFSAVVHSASIRIGKDVVLLSHYSYRSNPLFVFWKSLFFGWKFKDNHKRPRDNGLFLIHGHTHSVDKTKKRMINVCVEAWNYYPVNLNQVVSLMQTQKNAENSRRIFQRLKALFRHKMMYFFKKIYSKFLSRTNGHTYAATHNHPFFRAEYKNMRMYIKY